MSPRYTTEELLAQDYFRSLSIPPPNTRLNLNRLPRTIPSGLAKQALTLCRIAQVFDQATQTTANGRTSADNCVTGIGPNQPDLIDYVLQEDGAIVNLSDLPVAADNNSFCPNEIRRFTERLLVTREVSRLVKMGAVWVLEEPTSWHIRPSAKDEILLNPKIKRLAQETAQTARRERLHGDSRLIVVHKRHYSGRVDTGVSS